VIVTRDWMMAILSVLWFHWSSAKNI